MKLGAGFGGMVLVVALSGCGSDGDSGSLADGLAAELNAQQELFCDCYEQLGFTTIGECRNGVVMIGPSMLQCAKDAFAEDEDASRSYLSCLLPLEETFTECMDRRLDCNDGDNQGLNPCLQDYSVGRQECIELPPAVTRDLENCGFSEL